MSIDPITAGIDLISTVVDKIFPDADAEKKRDLAIQLAQIQVNNSEAQSTNWFVAGWRPFVGWVCGFGFGWQYVLQPLFAFIMVSLGHKVDMPVLDTGALVTMLGGLLGLGTLRTYEKKTGAESNRNG